MFAIPGQLKSIPVNSVTPICDAWRKAGGPALPFEHPLYEAARWESASWETMRDGSNRTAEKCFERAVEALSIGKYRLEQSDLAKRAERFSAGRGAPSLLGKRLPLSAGLGLHQ